MPTLKLIVHLIYFHRLPLYRTFPVHLLGGKYVCQNCRYGVIPNGVCRRGHLDTFLTDNMALWVPSLVVSEELSRGGGATGRLLRPIAQYLEYSIANLVQENIKVIFAYVLPLFLAGPDGHKKCDGFFQTWVQEGAPKWDQQLPAIIYEVSNRLCKSNASVINIIIINIIIIVSIIINIIISIIIIIITIYLLSNPFRLSVHPFSLSFFSNFWSGHPTGCASLL